MPTYQLVERLCARDQCFKKPFRVLSTSKQKFCCLSCERINAGVAIDALEFVLKAPPVKRGRPRKIETQYMLDTVRRAADGILKHRRQAYAENFVATDESRTGLALRSEAEIELDELRHDIPVTSD